MRSTRAWVYVLSVAALLVPAGGIAYLGAVSYRDERGAVDAQLDRQNAAALGIAARIDRAIEAALDAERPTTLGRYWFAIDADGKLRVPRAGPRAVELGGATDRGASCGGGALEDCVRELATRQSRLQRLRVALRAEATGTPASLAEAKRQDTALAAFTDTGPAALLGLARVQTRLGDEKAAEAALVELDRRFGDHAPEGLPMKLASAELRAEAGGPDALLALAMQVLDDQFAVSPIVELGVIARLIDRLPATLTETQTKRRAEIDQRVVDIRRDARVAAGLADDLPDLIRSATTAWRGRAAARQPGRTLIYRRRADNSIIGFAVDAPMLEEAAGHDSSDDVAQHVRTLVLPAGATPDLKVLRKIAQVSLGTELPHLSVALVNPILDSDPLDEVIRERSRRHVLFTSALAVALGLGILATIRGAARARELAQLKSDFVSTVSHELKTPLTSIRMFAEMLEQGVAKGDAAKMARYHGVIVQESQRLGLLIANLLDYAQIERGTRRYAPSHQELPALARQAITTFETLTENTTRNPITIEVSPEAMVAEVDADRDVVVQALLNLLANAAKYGGVDQPIEVSAGADAETGWIAVRDHGPGIPAAEQARIFREFYRSPEAYRSGIEGTGLGLALVKRHVEALGGTVEVASTVGEGATFTIRLPRTTPRRAA